MTAITLLDGLKVFIEAHTKDIILTTRPAKGGTVKGKPGKRAAEVHKMRLPEREVADATEKRVPYIVIQVITGTDEQHQNPPDSTCRVRIIVCTYSEDGGEGANDVLNLITRIRIALLRAGVIGEQFLLRSPVEFIVYPDDTSPYFFGELMTVWEMPVIQREIDALMFDELTTETEVM